MKKLKKFTIDELEQSYQTIAKHDLQYYVGGSGGGSGYENDDARNARRDSIRNATISCSNPMVEDLVRSIRDSAYIDLRRFCNPNSYDISMKNPVTVWVGNDSIRIRYVNVTVYEGAYKGVPHYMMPTGLANDVQTNNPWDIYKFFSGKNLPTLYIGVAKGSGSGVFEDLIRTN